jgi:O-antigen ligase
VRLSAPLLPAILLFFLVAGHFDGIKSMRLLYFTFSVVVLGLSSMLLWSVLRNNCMDPSVWVSKVGSPVLVVKNDVAFLSVVTPLSLALLYLKPRSVLGVVATLSVLLSVAVVGIFQSRGAMLTIIGSVTCFFFLIKPRIGLTFGITTILLLLLADGLMGFPLIERFIGDWDGNGRIPLWLSAWEMFFDRPLLGHGPHTFVLFYGSYLHDLSLPSWSIDLRIIPGAQPLS